MNDTVGMDMMRTFTVFPDSMRSIQHHADLVIFVISLLSNCTLIMLTLREKNRVIQAYSNVLILNCAFDVMSTIVSFITGVQIELGDGYVVILISNKLLDRLPIHWHYVLMHLYAFSIACAIHAIAVSFYFRYNLVCKNRILGLRQLIGMLTIPLLYGFLECIALALSFHEISDTPERAKICRHVLNHAIWCGQNGKPPDRCIVSRMGSPWLVTFIVAAGAIHIAVYSVMTGCGIAIHRSLKKNCKAFSQKTRQMHRQFSLMQLVQMIAPLFTAFIPLATFLIVTVFRLSLPGVGLLVCMLFACIPLVNPIVAIIFVASFRRALLDFICPCAPRAHRSKNSQTTTYSVSRTNLPDNTLL